MKAPILLVTAALTVAILLAASLLIATGTRGEEARAPLKFYRSGWNVPVSPAAK